MMDTGDLTGPATHTSVRTHQHPSQNATPKMIQAPIQYPECAVQPFAGYKSLQELSIHL
jgi:hypothetical protein